MDDKRSSRPGQWRGERGRHPGVGTELVSYVVKQTDYKARQIVRRVAALGDVEDVQHVLIEDVLRRLPKFNGERAGVKTFICRVINNKIASLLKSHNAACRRNGCAGESLDDWGHDDEGCWVRRGTTIGEDRARAHTGQAPRSRRELLELAMDMAGVAKLLPEDLHALYVRLRSQTVLEISRETDMSRSAIYKRIAAIRAVFLAAGLHHYL